MGISKETFEHKGKTITVVTDNSRGFGDIRETFKYKGYIFEISRGGKLISCRNAKACPGYLVVEAESFDGVTFWYSMVDDCKANFDDMPATRAQALMPVAEWLIKILKAESK